MEQVRGVKRALREDRWDEAAGRHHAWWPKPHNDRAVVSRKRWRPAMEHIGIDVHRLESQLCILGERAPARILIEASTESEWVARCLEQLGHEVVWAIRNSPPCTRPAAAGRR